MDKALRLQKGGEPFTSETEDRSLKQSTTFLGRRYRTLEFRVTSWSDGKQNGGQISIPASQHLHKIGYQRFRIVNIESDSVDMIPLDMHRNFS